MGGGGVAAVLCVVRPPPNLLGGALCCAVPLLVGRGGCRIQGPGPAAPPPPPGPTSGQIGYIPPAVWVSPTPQSTGQNQDWPPSGWNGQITPAV